jgi:hypothetical protein
VAPVLGAVPERGAGEASMAVSQGAAPQIRSLQEGAEPSLEGLEVR